MKCNLPMLLDVEFGEVFDDVRRSHAWREAGSWPPEFGSSLRESLQFIRARIAVVGSRA